jgi:cytochrome c553
LRSGPGDPVAGREKSQLCQGCHGEEGISLEGLIPKLAGQYGKYIAKELRNYQSGTRSHQIMNAMAATISDEDLADIAAYFASRTKMKGAGSNNELGKKLFLQGDISRTMVACVNCHGINGKGLTPNTSMFPVIGGQQKDYIRRQLVNFRKGDRTNSPNGIMNRITQKLTDDELEALADYVSGQ